jgi:FKBP-type peptidyl-prolyl cis-trans isomerase FkpA
MGKIIGIITGAILFVVMLSSCNINSPETSEPNTPEKEQRLLGEYLDKLVTEGYDIDTTDLGIYYVMMEEGDSIIQYPQAGDTVVVGYSGYFINGALFDTSDFYNEDGKYQFILGETPMIEGWDDGIKKVNKGETAQLIIPSEYAYGSAGYGAAIPPYSTVIFVVQVFDIRPPVATS